MKASEGRPADASLHAASSSASSWVRPTNLVLVTRDATPPVWPALGAGADLGILHARQVAVQERVHVGPPVVVDGTATSSASRARDTSGGWSRLPARMP
jgi:hypothetical protein